MKIPWGPTSGTRVPSNSNPFASRSRGRVSPCTWRSWLFGWPRPSCRLRRRSCKASRRQPLAWRIRRAVRTDILHFAARVVVTSAGTLTHRPQGVERREETADDRFHAVSFAKTGSVSSWPVRFSTWDTERWSVGKAQIRMWCVSARAEAILMMNDPRVVRR